MSAKTSATRSTSRTPSPAPDVPGPDGAVQRPPIDADADCGPDEDADGGDSVTMLHRAHLSRSGDLLDRRAANDFGQRRWFDEAMATSMWRVEHVAAVLGVDVSTIRRWTDKGAACPFTSPLPGEKLGGGGCWRFWRDEVEAWFHDRIIEQRQHREEQRRSIRALGPRTQRDARGSSR